MEMELYRKSYGNDGEPVYGEELTTEEMVAQIGASSEWNDFSDRFDMSKESNNVLFGMLIDDKLGPNPSLDEYKNLILSVMRAGGIVSINGTQYEFEIREEKPIIKEPEVPRDKNGNPLSESQLRWSEYRTFSESNSMEVCRQRAKTDAGYGSFFRKQYERQTGEVGDRVENLNQRQQVGTPAEALVAFAAEYHRTPTEKLRQLKRFDTNPYGAADWNRKFEACVAAGLI